MPALFATTTLGSHLGALAVVCAGIAALLGSLAVLGRWAAATHPAPAPKPAGPPGVLLPVGGAPPGADAELVATAMNQVAPEVMAAIAAAIAVTCGPRVRIAHVSPAAPETAPGVEALMLHWSLEGRRQIYSSHRVR